MGSERATPTQPTPTAKEARAALEQLHQFYHGATERGRLSRAVLRYIEALEAERDELIDNSGDDDEGRGDATGKMGER